MAEKSRSQQDLKQIRLRVVRHQGDVTPQYANNFVIQADGPEFHIRFYQLPPPVIVGDDPEETKAQIEALNGVVDAQCIAHLVLAKDRMTEFLDLLTAHYNKHTKPDNTSDNGVDQNDEL